MAARGDGDERTVTTGTVSVADLYRRLGAAPSPTDSAATGATPLLIGDLLRREGHPAVAPAAPSSPPAPPSRPAPSSPPPPSSRSAENGPHAENGPADGDEDGDEDGAAAAAGIPVPRHRTAPGADGPVVAGSVLGATLLAAAGVGGPIFSLQGDGAAEVFGGGASAGSGAKARGAVTGEQVVSAAGLLRKAY